MSEISDQLLALYETTPVLVAAYDAFDRLRYANAAFRAAFHVEPGEAPTWAELMRRNHRMGRGTVVNTPDMEAWLVSTISRRGKESYRAFETDLADGRWLLMTEAVSADGWMLCIASEITSFRPDERTVRQDRDLALRAAHTDDLTGISNRRFVTARVGDMLAPGGPGGGCLCVLDLDNFKYINDRYGHQAGDVILRDFATRINGQVRRSDCFGRVGGEEFVLVLPATGVVEAELIVERMLAVVRLSRPLPQRPDFAYTFSAGIAEARPDDSFSDIYGRADRALYVAKMEGRNRIHVDDEMAPPAAGVG
ncbi:GGDEF domain-containing protein [Xanthobacter dioxanivorans]|uniref:diguanylate cyclase n=1 Tax=Xanthobacter dioxanivorans TaxID=2528964 RepID=A0A974PK29_9HYPH|nr:GGDEF domain-containing protein [Xanthobacter dioxanivorans]QRG04818.1 GGDEF domain-containing protein [Xanthobacter dioxanivorans]